LEESLEMCQGQGAEREVVEHETRDTVTNAMIDEEYEQYLNARKRALEAVQSLSKPVQVDSGQHLDGNHESMIRTSSPSTMRGHGVEANGLLNAVEKVLLATLQRRDTIQAHHLVATEQIDDEHAKTVNMLDRLADESQLLQAFPILARSGRFQHAASTLGKRPDNDDKTKDEISQRMEPWMFAANAADVALSGALEKALGEGKQAMESVSKSLAELRLLKDASDDHNFVL